MKTLKISVPLLVLFLFSACKKDLLPEAGYRKAHFLGTSNIEADAQISFEYSKNHLEAGCYHLTSQAWFKDEEGELLAVDNLTIAGVEMQENNQPNYGAQYTRSVSCNAPEGREAHDSIAPSIGNNIEISWTSSAFGDGNIDMYLSPIIDATVSPSFSKSQGLDIHFSPSVNEPVDTYVGAWLVYESDLSREYDASLPEDRNINYLKHAANSEGHIHFTAADLSGFPPNSKVSVLLGRVLKKVEIIDGKTCVIYALSKERLGYLDCLP